MRELYSFYEWDAKARDTIDTKGPLSAYEGSLMSFSDDSVLHATGVMAHPVVRCMLAKGLQACTSVEEEEDVLYHYKAVLGLLSRMCVPRFQYDSGVTVSEWMDASVPQHVRRTEPMGREKTYRDKCAVLEGALRGASLPGVGAARKVVTAWTCALYAGVVHASWLMEAGIHRANVLDIYPDAMAHALPFLPYHSNYTSLFAVMEARNLVSPHLILAVKGDSQLINTVESMLFAKGIVGSNGVDGTVAPYLHLEKAYSRHIRQTARTKKGGVDCCTNAHEKIPDAIVEHYLRFVCYRQQKSVFATRERMDTSVVNAIKKGKLAPMLTAYMCVHARQWYCT